MSTEHELPMLDDATALDIIARRIVALDVLQALRGNGLGYPTLTQRMQSIMRCEVEDRADLGGRRIWEHNIPADHPLHKYTQREPDGMLASLTIDDTDQAIALGHASLTKDVMACVIADAIASLGLPDELLPWAKRRGGKRARVQQ
jgi:hypothetical protein